MGTPFTSDHRFSPGLPKLRDAGVWDLALCWQPGADPSRWDTPQGPKAAATAHQACLDCKVKVPCLLDAAWNQPGNQTPTGVRVGLHGDKLRDACERVRAGADPADIVGGERRS